MSPFLDVTWIPLTRQPVPSARTTNQALHNIEHIHSQSHGDTFGPFWSLSVSPQTRRTETVKNGEFSHGSTYETWKHLEEDWMFGAADDACGSPAEIP